MFQQGFFDVDDNNNKNSPIKANNNSDLETYSKLKYI